MSWLLIPTLLGDALGTTPAIGAGLLSLAAFVAVAMTLLANRMGQTLTIIALIILGGALYFIGWLTIDGIIGALQWMYDWLSGWLLLMGRGL